MPGGAEGRWSLSAQQPWNRPSPPDPPVRNAATPPLMDVVTPETRRYIGDPNAGIRAVSSLWVAATGGFWDTFTADGGTLSSHTHRMEAQRDLMV